MLKQYLLSTFFIFLTLALNAQTVPNGGFENWTNGNPDNWYADNIPTIALPVTPSITAHSGSFSVKGTVVNTIGGLLQPIVQSGTNAQGFSVSQRYKTVSGYFQFGPIQHDIFALNFLLSKNGTTIASCASLISDSISAWAQFSLDFAYITNDIPDNCILQFTVIGPGSGSDYHEGSFFLLDDLSLSGISNITPVELSTFAAFVNKGNVILNWQTATEVNNKGFEIQRKSSGSNYSTIAFVDGHGTTTKSNNYYWSEKLQLENYSYRLKQIDFNGKFEYSKEVEVTIAPQTFSLSQNYPNPFNPSTTISFSIPSASNVKLKICNTLGQEIKTLVSDYKPAGNYSVNFNASALPSGIYFYKLEAGQYTQTKKMLLLK